MLLKINSVLRKAAMVLACLSAAVLVIFTLFTVVSVFARYIFSSPITGFTEMAECLVCVSVFGCLAYTQTENGHVSIVMLLKRFPDALAMPIYALGYLLITAVSFVITYSLFAQGQYAVSKSLVTALLNIPYPPFYFFASLCMLVFSLTLLSDTVIGFAAIFSKPLREKIREQWV